MHIVKTEFKEENGIKFQIDTYNTGAVIKHPWIDPDAPQPESEPEPQPEPEPAPTPSVTLEELNQNQLTIMEALTDLYTTISEAGVE